MNYNYRSNEHKNNHRKSNHTGQTYVWIVHNRWNDKNKVFMSKLKALKFFYAHETEGYNNPEKRNY